MRDVCDGILADSGFYKVLEIELCHKIDEHACVGCWS